VRRTRHCHISLTLIAAVCVAAIASGCATTGGTDASAEVAPGIQETAPDTQLAGVFIHESGKNAIIFDNGCAYTVESPEGWILDNSLDVPYPSVVFYPDRGSWKTSPAVMYTHEETKHCAIQNVQQAIYSDETVFERVNPGVFVKTAETLKTSGGVNSAEVRYYYYTSYDAVAYIEEARSIVYVILTARDAGAFEDSLPAFEKLIGSYYYIGDGKGAAEE